MSQKIIYERFLWFHNNVKSGNCPNARTLSEHFEISRKTAQRDIEFMRDRLGAPLGFDRFRRGYIYEDNSWELPGFWMKEEELTSLLVAYRLASAIPDSTLKESFKSFLNQVLSKRPHGVGITIDDLKEKVSIKNIEYSETSDTVFRLALEALLFSRSLAIDYYSPHSGQSTSRYILPLHLLHYSGTWHLIAWCGLKQEIRDFVLSRISAITLSKKHIRSSLPTGSIKAYLRRNFGIMNSGESREVRLRFSPHITDWIAEMRWHREEKKQIDEQGWLCLTIPVADFREIKREILKYGADVEVLKPSELREEVKREIKKMALIYR